MTGPRGTFGSPDGVWPALTRREFLGWTLFAGLAGATAGCGADEPEPSVVESGAATRLAASPFGLGVASGDPLSDRVILWTRLAYADPRAQPLPQEPIAVTWVIAADPEIQRVVAAGTATAEPGWAHSVHIDVSGLEPDTVYWYRFTSGGHASPIGRTKTLPRRDSSPERFRFAVASCQNFGDGYFTAYPHLVEEDIDLVVFLGDYIYGSGDDPVRRSPRQDLFSLESYRDRYTLYKRDAGLQAAHAAFPWAVIWDDHEYRNNYSGGDKTKNMKAFAQRSAAYRAFYENTPIRAQRPVGPEMKIYRSLPVGDLVTFQLLDIRQYRSEPACGAKMGPACAELRDPDITMLGAEQEAWLDAQLSKSHQEWNVLVQQVPMVSTALGDWTSLDHWDGYPVARDRMLASLGRESVRNPVVLSGDIHAAGVGLISDRDERAIATEFITPSISAGSDKAAGSSYERAVGDLEQIQYFNWHQRGYLRCEITRDAWTADFRLVDTVSQPQSPIETASSWRIDANRIGAVEGS